MQHDITIIGAAIMDVLAGPVDNSIFEKGSLPMKNINLSFGGDALNEAVILSQLGADVELISKVGNDEAGKRVLDFLKEKEVFSKIKVEDGLETGINIVLIDENGERRFLTNPDSSLRKLSEEDVMESLDEAGDIVCMASLFVSPLLDIGAMERIFKKIKSKPERIMIADMTTAKNGETIEDIANVLKYIDYIIPNEVEAERLTGEKDVYKNAELFLEHGVSCVVIKRGKNGCLIKTQNQQIEVPAFIGAKVIDTTGAGDSFVAGFIWGLKNGWTLEECGRFGCAVASCTVEKIGANSAIQSIELPMKRYHEMLNK
ncbi:MAG: carbohydrate kinase family protein [Agathobacter sp.]|nr:carbohydrate kinase family protein [Agathobacter sp.]